ncbi:MAG: hypothetical protein KTR29_19575 [Rhodothermaceae bacterium]|nr:hypothetical protein [Rhodothermaceae bacterium]
MTTNNSNNDLGHLKEKLLTASREEIAQVVTEAKSEALQEAKAMLKERMLEAILTNAMSKVNRLTTEPAILIVDEQAE